RAAASGLFCGGGGVAGPSACPCRSNADCGDNNPCTDDACENPGTPTATCVTVNNTAPRSDGNAYTRTGARQGGVCTGSNPVVCTPSDQCHLTGTCDPETGACSNPPAPNGTACSDGNACTRNDACEGGACTGSNPVVCTPSDQCHLAGTCNPETGACSNPPAPNGTACND